MFSYSDDFTLPENYKCDHKSMTNLHLQDRLQLVRLKNYIFFRLRDRTFQALY